MPPFFPADQLIQGAHILLIDDNRMGLTARKAVLEELGYQVSAFHNPAAALEEFRKAKFDLIITDYKMPGISGVEIIAQARKQAPATPVVLLSGFADAMGLNEKNTGADLVIQKSSNEVSHMVRAVRSLLKKSLSRKPPAPQPGPPRRRKQA